MPNDVVIDLDLLERAFALAIRHLREQQGAEVKLDRDMFWSVPVAELFEVHKTPTDLTIGQVTECLEWLRNLVDNPDDALNYHLVWIADIVRAVGLSVSEGGPRSD